MSERQRLREIARPLARAILPEGDLRHANAVKGAIQPDGGIAPQALRRVVPLQVMTWSREGAATVSTALDGLRRLPQAAVLQRIDVLTTAAPTGSSLTARLWNATTSEEIDRVNVPNGQRVGSSGESKRVPAGTLLSVDILAVGSVTPGSDVTVQVAYLPVTG